MDRKAVKFLFTTNVVKIPLSILAGILFIVAIPLAGFAQNSASYQKGETGSLTPVVTLEQFEEKQASASQAAPQVLDPLLAPVKTPLSLPTLETKKVEDARPAGKEILLAGNSKFIYDEASHTGTFIEAQGEKWNYDHVAIVNDLGRTAPPLGFVEVGNFVGQDASSKRIYGKPAWAIQEIVLGLDKTFIYDSKTQSGALLDLGEPASIKQYQEVRLVSAETHLLGEGFMKIGEFTEIETVLPNGTTVLAKKLIYAKFDRNFFFLENFGIAEPSLDNGYIG